LTRVRLVLVNLNPINDTYIHQTLALSRNICGEEQKRQTWGGMAMRMA
jgi:hypothetical protein